jgi:hypothetical protein
MEASQSSGRFLQMIPTTGPPSLNTREPGSFLSLYHTLETLVAVYPNKDTYYAPNIGRHH